MADTQQINKTQGDSTNYATLSALQLRLNTQPLLDQLEMFLKGERTVYSEVGGKINSEKITTGKEKVNDKGVQSIMAYVSSIINPSVVQGNFDAEQYENYIYNCRLELTEDVVINRGIYNIDGDDLNLIINFCMKLIEPFISRLIDNKERDSYEATLRTVENSRLETGKKFGLFNQQQT